MKNWWRILTEGQAAVGTRMLEIGLRREILPEVEFNSHLERSLEMLQKEAQPDFAMAVLLHETTLLQVQGIIERLKFSRAEIHHVLALVENLPNFYESPQDVAEQIKRFFRLFRFEDHLELARIHGIAAGEECGLQPCFAHVSKDGVLRTSHQGRWISGEGSDRAWILFRTTV